MEELGAGRGAEATRASIPVPSAACVVGNWTLGPREVVEGEAAVWGALWEPDGGERAAAE